MAASAFITTTGQYPIWIEEDKIYCDEAKLKDHLTQNLNYNETDAAMIVQRLTGHIKYGLYYFWWSAAERMGTEAVRVLLHSIEHSQVIYMLVYQAGNDYTALHWCAFNKRNEVIKVILDSVSEEECYQLLNITDNMRWTPLHWSCYRGDTESVRLMLNHITQDMRYSLLQMTSDRRNTPLHLTSYSDCSYVMKVINESVTQTQWINLLQMENNRGLTVLQRATYYNKQSSIETIRDSVSDEEWLQLVSTPLPEYDQWIHDNDRYQQAVDWIDELRAAARVKSVLQTENNSGMQSLDGKHIQLTLASQ